MYIFNNNTYMASILTILASRARAATRSADAGVNLVVTLGSALVRARRAVAHADCLPPTKAEASANLYAFLLPYGTGRSIIPA